VVAYVEIGQKVEVDLFGLKISGDVLPSNARSTATIVGLAPGTITVRLELEGHSPSEVTISPDRIERWV
jgi:hypothetical protein